MRATSRTCLPFQGGDWDPRQTEMAPASASVSDGFVVCADARFCRLFAATRAFEARFMGGYRPGRR